MVFIFVVALSSGPNGTSLSGVLEHSQCSFRELSFPKTCHPDFGSVGSLSIPQQTDK